MGARGAQATLCGVTLLFVLGQGQRASGSSSCGRDRLLLGTGTDARCCGPCSSAKACPEGTCVCVQPEYHCGDPQCNTCKHHRCLPGQEVKAYGEFTFGFQCVDCAPGTFSEDSKGHCQPWADCSQLGLRTVFPGNQTHNALCSPALPPAELRCPLTVVLAVAACILVVVVAQLGLHIWHLRKQREWLRGAQTLLEAPLLPPPPPPPPTAEDNCSCQFPEEEWGERLSEDKGQVGNLWV